MAEGSLTMAAQFKRPLVGYHWTGSRWVEAEIRRLSQNGPAEYRTPLREIVRGRLLAAAKIEARRADRAGLAPEDRPLRDRVLAGDDQALSVYADQLVERGTLKMPRTPRGGWRRGFQPFYLHPQYPSVGLRESLRRHSEDFIWVSDDGAFERAATLYEVEHPLPPPRDNWCLISRSSEHKHVEPGLAGDLAREKARRAAERREARVKEARAKVAEWEQTIAHAKDKLKEWKRKLRARERALEKQKGE
jgi:hypothetical protein